MLENTDSLIEIAQLHFERCDFISAIEKYKQASQIYLKQKKMAEYLECLNKLLRMYAEQEDYENIYKLKEKLQDLVLKESFELNSKTYYTLGICATYKRQYEIALEYFQKALAVALTADHKPDICYAINGIAIVYYSQDRLQDALKEIYNLRVFYEVIPMTELRLSTEMMNAHILRKLKKFDQALEILWNCYDMARDAKNMFSYFCLLFGMGLTYKEAGSKDLALMYLQLAKRSVDPRNLKVLYQKIESQLADMGSVQTEEYDLVLDSVNNVVTEKMKGRLDFKNQFVLLEMLRLFMKNPGTIHPKENLVKFVWKQEYEPSVHDNKIYVTIKRLRKLIEPDYDKPKYIFRAKNGYYLNKSTKIHFD